MRSEERFGIIYAALLLLWGTLITEPLRIYTDYFHEFLSEGFEAAGLAPEGKAGTLAAAVGMTVIAIILMIPSRTQVYRFVPVTLMTVTLAVFLIRCLGDKHVDKRSAAALMIAEILIGLMHLLKSETVLLWASDTCIYSLSIYVTCGLMIKPLSGLGGVADKILYAARYVPSDLAAPFDDVLSMPGYVWGIFIGVLLLIPQIYCVFMGRKG